MIAGSFLSVIPVDWLERSDLEPFCKQVRLRCSCKSSYVGATHGKTAEAQVLKHRRCQAKMIPRAAVVPGPGRGITLPSSVSGARQPEGPQARIEMLQSFEGSGRIFNPEWVLIFSMGGRTLHESGFVDAVDDIFGHCLRWNVKD